MYCPECKAEYVEGIKECAECRIPLVAVLPPEPDHTGAGFVRVMSTYNPGDIATIKPVMENAEIEYYFQGENFADLYPLVQPAILYVRRGQEARAKELLADTHINYLGISPPDADRT
jgi:hypothetical protein